MPNKDPSINRFVRADMESGKDDMQDHNFIDYSEDECSPDCLECKGEKK